MFYGIQRHFRWKKILSIISPTFLKEEKEKKSFPHKKILGKSLSKSRQDRLLFFLTRYNNKIKMAK